MGGAWRSPETAAVPASEGNGLQAVDGQAPMTRCENDGAPSLSRAGRRRPPFRGDARSEAVSPPHRMKSDRRKRQRGRQAIARRKAQSGPSWSGRQAVTSPWWAAWPKAGRRRILLDDASDRGGRGRRPGR